MTERKSKPKESKEEKRTRKKLEMKAIKKLDMKSIKRAVTERAEMMNERDVANIRAKWLPRWAKLCDCPKDENGVYDYSQIDYENKWVKIEWYLCDPYILFKIGNEKKREEGLALLPEDCRETFYEQAPMNDRPYCEIYTGKSQIMHSLDGIRNKKKLSRKPEEN